MRNVDRAAELPVLDDACFPAVAGPQVDAHKTATAGHEACTISAEQQRQKKRRLTVLSGNDPLEAVGRFRFNAPHTVVTQ